MPQRGVKGMRAALDQSCTRDAAYAGTHIKREIMEAASFAAAKA